MSAHRHSHAHSRASFALPQRAAFGGLHSLWAMVRTRLAKVSSRRRLRSADPRLLADLGISPAQADFIAGRAPWKSDLPR